MMEEIRKMLIEDKINVLNMERVKIPSGQKLVYFIDTDKEKLALKMVDVTPQILIDELESEIDENILQQEITLNSYRIIEEIKMSKHCPNFPQIKQVENNDYIKYIRINGKVYLIYIEQKFEGDTLEKLLLENKKEYTIDEILDFLIQLVNHIKIMSSNGYVHRDIKPSNIIVKDSTYYIIGGICKDLNSNINLTRTGSEIGTKRYLAPEQKKIVQNYNWSFQTDLYPLGIIATEMLNAEARRFYTSDDDIRDIQVVKDLWLSKDNSNHSQRIFKTIIVTIMHKIKALRFNNIDECIQQLENIKKEVI